MSRSRNGIRLAVIIVLLTAGAAFYETNDARLIRREFAHAADDRRMMTEELRRSAEKAREAEARANAAEAALQAVRAAAIPPTFGTAASRAVAPPPPSSTAAAPDMLDRLNTDPNYLQASLNLHRATLRIDYGPFYHRLGLAPEKITALEDVLVDQAAALIEVRQAALAQGVAPTDPALAALGKPIYLETADRIRQQLGADGLQAFVDYSNVVRARASSVDPLAGSLYYTDTPLTAAQADRLIDAIRVTTTKYGTSGLVSTGNDTDWPKVIAQAQAFLSPPQIETLQALRKKADAQKELQSAALKVRPESAPAPVVNEAKPVKLGGG